MIKQTQKDQLKAMGFDVEAIINAAKADTEVDITIPAGTFLTDEQLTIRDGEKLKEGTITGKSEAFGIAKKELGKAGFEVKSERFGDLANELKGLISKDADSKYKTLEEQNAALIADKQTLSGKLSELESNISRVTFESDLLNKFPNAAPGLKSTKETYELAKLRGYEFKQEDGATVILKDGKPLTDKNTHAPLPLDAGIAHIYESEGWKPAPAAPKPGGRGVPQAPGTSGVRKLSEAMAEWEEANPGKNIASAEGQAYINEQSKLPGFVMNEA
jgi:hypothetical protein